MSVTFAAIRVGEPIRHETLSVFPLIAGHRAVPHVAPERYRVTGEPAQFN
jgi:hypothetical protein